MSTSPTPSSPSRPSSTRSGSKASLKLDLSSLPPIIQPTPPTNTLLITNLNDLEIFRPDNLQKIRDLINATAPIVTWSPLKSFRRIVVSFADEQAAINVRSAWDGEAVMGERCRVYFGQHTPTDLQSTDQHLALPDAGKLFFISPPPSPPHGWEMKLEDEPNKQVHAEDLAEALAKLHQRKPAPVDMSPVSPVDGCPSTMRSRSSTLIYEPDQTFSPHLPCIAVDAFAEDEAPSPLVAEKPIMAHTSLPPVELLP